MENEENAVTTRTYSASSESAWRDCPRKWWWAYRHRYQPAEKPDALATGIAWHQLLEDWHAHGKLPSPDAAPDTKREAMLHAMILAYSEIRGRWPTEQVIATEQRFELPLLDPAADLQPVSGWKLVGYIDLVIEDDRGTWIVEHKSTSQDIAPGADYWNRLQLDPQLTTYWQGCQQAMGIQPSGILYDVARKPAHRPKKGEGLMAYRDRVYGEIMGQPERYFRRETTRRLISQVEQHMRSMAVYARQMQQAIAEGYAPQNPSSCNRFGTCDFWAVCCAGPDATPGQIPGAFTKRGRG